MGIEFEAGQVWRMKARPQDGDAHLAILAVTDHEALGQVCSIAVTNVCLRNPHVPGGVQEMLPHAPVTAAMVEAAVGEMVAEDGPTADDPDFEGPFQEWLEPFEKGEAGVFTIPITDILDLIEKSVSPAN